MSEDWSFSWLRTFILVATLVALAFSLYSIRSWISRRVVFANGSRTGTLAALIPGGQLGTAWQGELVIPGATGTSTELFTFSIEDGPVARILTAWRGKKITVQYTEHRRARLNSVGEATYVVNHASLAAEQ